MFAAYNRFPPIRELLRSADKARGIVVCLPDREVPQLCLSENAGAAEKQLAETLRRQLNCLQFAGPNVLKHTLPDAELWLMPPSAAGRLHEYFDEGVVWQTESIMQQTPSKQKLWFVPPERRNVEHAAVVGAGIAGAATARALADRGVAVSVLEAGEPAQAASGNRQGLLYAKISPYDTEQTELLLCGYGYTRRLLERFFPNRECWGGDGILHLNHNQAEAERNAKLAEHAHHRHLYRGVSAEEASAVAGIAVPQSALFWPNGVWLHPPALIRALLDHPNIRLHTRSPLHDAVYNGTVWQLAAGSLRLEADCMVYCTGAASADVPPLRHFPFRLTRGQTALAQAACLSEKLKTALSGASYIAPAWQGLHCYGATFVQHDSSGGWREEEEEENRRMLAELNPALAAGLFSDRHSAPQGHAAVRCDCNDHLPVVGPIGDAERMKMDYAKLSDDRKYRFFTTPCAYLPGVYANTAHGTRGLASAPVCAESLAAEILGLPNPLSRRIREALHPNRHIVRAIGKGEL